VTVTVRAGVPLAPIDVAGYSLSVFPTESATQRLLTASNASYAPVTESDVLGATPVVNSVLVNPEEIVDPPLVLPIHARPEPGTTVNVTLM
jgi:hypothetical protein